MMYKAKDFSFLIGIMGLSEKLLKTHFELYQGYVANTNKLIEKISTATKTGNLADQEFTEIKRRFSWEWNGMRLHELYFENLTKNNTKLDKKSLFAQKTIQDFGSLENWEKDFKATGAMRGIGWVICYFDLEIRKLFNIWIAEHDCGHISGGIPLLIMDVFEHAYLRDYSIKRADYIETFFKIIDWQKINTRLTVHSDGTFIAKKKL